MKIELKYKGEVVTVLMDDDDAHLITGRHLYIDAGVNTLYVKSYVKGIPVREQKKIYLHQLIVTNVPKGYKIDHENRDGLDNRRENLRIISHTGNCRNRRVKKKSNLPMGVARCRDKFTAKMTINKNKIYLGIFPTAEAAGDAYQCAAKKQFEKETL